MPQYFYNAIDMHALLDLIVFIQFTLKFTKYFI